MSDIRAAIRDFSLREAEGPDRELIIALYEAFDEHNARFWDSALTPVPILITPPTSPKAFADASEFSGFGCRQQLRMRPACARGVYPIGAYGTAPKPGWRMLPGHPLKDRLRWLSDVVLHEMVHLWLNQIEHPDRHDHQGHGKPFCAECNRISSMMSPALPNVVPRRRKGQAASLPIGAQWPHNVRPGGEHGPCYGLLWELISGEEELDDGGFAALCVAHDKASEEALDRFQERYGYVIPMAESVTVTINPDERQAPSPPPAVLPEERTATVELPSIFIANGDTAPSKRGRGRPRKLPDDPKIQAKRERDRERKKALREAAAAVLANGDAIAA
jgi:hypothetical protein